jgi:anti-sigma regulatory factor (Ser/Thr protein kinase)
VNGGSERRRTFDLDPHSVAAVRSFVSDHASQFGADPDTAALLASELASNAVLHANSHFEVRLPADGQVFRVEVVNDAPEMIAAMRDPSDTSGRGLHIVDGLSQRWGTDVVGSQKIVWFELPTANAPQTDPLAL